MRPSWTRQRSFAFAVAWAALFAHGPNSAALAAGGVADADADAAAAAAQPWLDLLARLNSASPVEPAGSHGSTGVALGVGATVAALPEGDELTNASLGREASDEDTSYTLPRLWLAKGLPWPVDLGMTAAMDPEQQFSQVAAHVQWTVFEALGLPAAALRASHGRVHGAAGTELASTGATAAVSYGFLRYFSLYAVGGATHNAATLVAEEEDDGGDALSLRSNGISRVEIDRKWWSPTRAVGLKITVLPPFVTVTGEGNFLPDGGRDYAVKLAVGI
jgi:hypothetical protein